MAHEIGLYILDEPASALSFTSSVALVQLLNDMRAAGSQVVVSTRSPVLAAVRGARLLELGEHVIRPVDYDDRELVRSCAPRRPISTGWIEVLDADDLQQAQRFPRG
jgi:predicted ATPase